MQLSESPDRFSDFDRRCMSRAMSLARRGMGKTAPNPLVGALIAREGRILGEGWHRRYGDKHAEAEALAQALEAGHSPEGSDLYCVLEPCSFTGPGKHQPPCVDLIIKHRIRRVVIACQDPYGEVNVRGIRALREAGIAVDLGLLAREGEELNRGFFTFCRIGRPYVRLKIAQSLDGRIAAPAGSARREWITDEAARRVVHRFRASHDAILIGRGTLEADDPELTTRLFRGPNPLRVILDSRLSIAKPARAESAPAEPARVLSLPDREKTLILCAEGADEEKARWLRDRGVQVVPLSAPPRGVSGASGDPPGASGGSDSRETGGSLPLDRVLGTLGDRGVRSILVEGGAAIFSSFLRTGLWDRISVFIAPLILGGGISAVSGLSIRSLGEALELREVRTRRIGEQILMEGNRVYGNR